MDKHYSNSVFSQIICILATIFIFLSFSPDAFAQKTGAKKYKKVNFNKDTRTNGYTITIKKDTVWLQLINVKKTSDSTKLFDGETELEYKCIMMNAWIKMKANIKSGKSKPLVIGTVSDPASGAVQVPDLTITICEGMALDNYQWHRKFIIQGDISE